MNYIKKEKGITLIALIVTIIVILIIAGVAISTLSGENGILKKAAKGKTETQNAKIREEVILFSLNYSINTNITMSEKSINNMIEIYTKTGISPEKLTVYYDLYNVKQNQTNGNKELQEEYILYRIDKTTEEERTILENFKTLEDYEEGIKPLRGDIDLDGFLTEKDMQMIADWLVWNIELSPEQLIVGDIDNSNDITYDDHKYLKTIIEGENHYSGGYIK